ncbi:cucumber peeling cupredoxin-like [Populus alba x Populus x berolinensis]|nr:cucumber peeling cupredoxin-like [Populus alba x Populus x berolinensis]
MAIRMDRIVFLIIAVALLEGATSETTYKVGDDDGWRVPQNKSYYESWAGDQKFEVGDSLEFNWTDTHDVLEVTTKTDYDACVITNGTPNNTNPVTIKLTKNGTFYYICTIGKHCVSGQKVTIVVGNGSSSSMPNNHAALSAVLSTITIVAASLVHLCSFLLY